MKKLAVGFGLTFCLMSAAAIAADIKLDDVTIDPGSYGGLGLNQTGVAWYVHQTLKCDDVSTTGSKMSFRAEHYYGTFGQAQVTSLDFPDRKITQNGSLLVTLSSTKAALVIHDIVYNGYWFGGRSNSDAIRIYNDGQGDGYGPLTLKGCVLTPDEDSPLDKNDLLKEKHHHKADSSTSDVTPPIADAGVNPPVVSAPAADTPTPAVSTPTPVNDVPADFGVSPV